MTEYLRVDLEVTLPRHPSVNGEFGGFVDDDARGLQTWTISFHLQRVRLLTHWTLKIP